MLSAVLRGVLAALAPAGARSRLSVLIFHRVLREPDALRPEDPTARDFELLLGWLRAKFNVLPLSDALRRLQLGELPARPLSITFDDGYRDNHELALPILSRLGLPATFFIATGYLDGRRMFNDTIIEAVRQARGDALDLSDLGFGRHPIKSNGDRRAAVRRVLEKLKYFAPEQRERVADQIGARVGATLPDDLMMTSDQVAHLKRAGMDLGGHTVSHPILAEIDLARAREEIVEGRRKLEALTGSRVGLFAYPNGRPGRDYSRQHVELVRELGFDAAVSTAWGAARQGADVFQIPRFTPWDRTEWRFGARLAQNLTRVRFQMA